LAPDAAVALLPACEAVMVQLPVLFRATVAEEAPPFAIDATDWLPLTMEHGPAALKLTCNPLGVLFDSAVAVTVMDALEIGTELGNEPRRIVCPSVSTAGGDGALERGVEPEVSGTSVVAIV
jgi:hypothetical protein